MDEPIDQRARKLQEFFGISASVLPDAPPPVLASELDAFNLEWYGVPPAAVVPFDGRYTGLLYRAAPKDFTTATVHPLSPWDAVAASHRRYEGTYVAIETTQKPRYLPRNRQSYGTPFGFDPTRDPFFRYFGAAGFTERSRYGHNYLAMAKFLEAVNEDWRARGLLPAGYRVTLCPPSLFNLVGTVFHPEWSETETLELGFHRDAHGNAYCFEVGSNAPGDFSFIRAIETDSEWTLLGFRIALVLANR
ncbi:MAG: hypothetical protein AB7N65_12140 [Vicinamibacterales bacterium]